VQESVIIAGNEEVLCKCVWRKVESVDLGFHVVTPTVKETVKVEQ
jgi:hypothetical protein